jgi:ParB-like chromosome segregation protein Spo0J
VPGVSIKEFGWRQAIVVDKDGVIFCGYTRLLAATKLGLKQVPVHVADNLTPAQVKAYRLTDKSQPE